MAVRPHVAAQDRFCRENFFPRDWDLVTQQFLSLFHRYGYIYKPLTGGSWLSANEKWKLTDSEILKAIACVHPRFFLGTRAGKTSRFAVLDIDAGSRYHNRKALYQLLQVLKQSGIERTVLYRSSFSDGWHLYIFFDEPISSLDLRRQLCELLLLHDYQIGKGTLEVFPHPGERSAGQGLRLPLQPGWAWLSMETLEVQFERSDLHPLQALEMFIDDLTADSNSYLSFRRLKTHVQELRSRRERAVRVSRSQDDGRVVPMRRHTDHGAGPDHQDFVRAIFQVMPPGIIPDLWYRGRLYHLQGLQGPSQRADAIFCLGHYLFYGDPSRELPALGYGCEQEREWAIRDFVCLRNNGQSKDINRGRADALEQAGRAARWVPQHKRNAEPTPYRATRSVAWLRENVNRKADARKRIADALDGLRKLGRAFTTVELQQAAACSRRTLYDHADIWRKDYDDLANGFFAICTDEYNAVVGAGSQETTPPATAEQKSTPPGLLAARRIADEVAARAKRQRDRSAKAAVRSREAAEREWQGQVQPLVTEPVSALPIERLKLLLAVLLAYLSTAPTHEDAVTLSAYIASIRQELAVRTTGPARLEVRPPPDS